MTLEWPLPAGDDPPPGSTHLIGVDEAGRGPVLGPLVVAAIAVPAVGGDEALRELGVRDSKRLQPSRRERIYASLADHPSKVIEVPAEDVDALRTTATLNVVEARVFATTVLQLLGELGQGVRAAVYIDAADASESTFERHFRASMGGDELTKGVVHLVCQHEADDNFPVVSAASIVAKSRREAAVARIRNELGEDIGSGYPSDPVTIAFLEKWISEKGVLPPHTRRSWRTAERLMERLAGTHPTLEDFTEDKEEG